VWLAPKRAELNRESAYLRWCHGGGEDHDRCGVEVGGTSNSQSTMVLGGGFEVKSMSVRQCILATEFTSWLLKSCITMHENRLYVIEVIKLYLNRAFGFMEFGNPEQGHIENWMVGKAATRRKEKWDDLNAVVKRYRYFNFWESVYESENVHYELNPNMDGCPCTRYPLREPSNEKWWRVLARISLLLGS